MSPRSSVGIIDRCSIAFATPTRFRESRSEKVCQDPESIDASSAVKLGRFLFTWMTTLWPSKSGRFSISSAEICSWAVHSYRKAGNWTSISDTSTNDAVNPNKLINAARINFDLCFIAISFYLIKSWISLISWTWIILCSFSSWSIAFPFVFAWIHFIVNTRSPKS